MAEWILAILAIASPVFSCGVIYGLMSGRLQQIEWRLEQIEGVLGLGNHSAQHRRAYERA